MNETMDILRGELERLFGLEEMQALSAELLGLDPSALGGDEAGKAAFARRLVEVCEERRALEALVDAAALRRAEARERLGRLMEQLREDGELPSGAPIGEWTLRRPLEEGPLGTVHLAERETEAGRERARLLLVRSSLARDEAAVARWTTAQRALRTAGVEGLLEVLDVGRLDDGRPWVASRFEAGQRLSERIGRLGPMHPNEARGLLATLFAAVEALVERGLAHGDVCPRNVLVARTEEAGRTVLRALLLDAGHDRLFPLAAPAEAGAGGAWQLYGTPSALAPERWLGRAPDAASEQYALGALLYELLTGTPPYGSEDPREAAFGWLRGTPEPPSRKAPKGWVSEAVDEVVLRALAVDPADRFESIAALREAFESAGRARGKKAGKAAAGTEVSEEALAKAVERLEQAPADEQAAMELERLGEASGQWQPVAEALAQAAERCEEPERAKALRFRAARIFETELEDAERAEALYRAILEADPEEELARAALEDVLRAAGRTEQLVELLLEKAEQLDSAEERAATLQEIAQLYEEMGDSEGAFAAYAAAFVERPGEERLREAVERLAAEAPQSRWAEVLETAAEAARAEETSVEDRVRLLVQMGRWYGEQLQRPDFALQCFGEALQHDPACESAYAGLEALYRKSQSWQELAGVLEQRAEREANPARQRALLVEAAEVWHRRLGDDQRAETLLGRVLEAEPGHPRAARLLEQMLTAQQRWQDLGELLERRAEEASGEARAELLGRLGELYEDRLQDDDKAAAFYDAALEVSEAHLPALKGLERIYAKLERYEKLLENLRRQLELVATPRQRIAILERIGALLEEEFVDREEAARAYERIVEIEPGHDQANRALARLYRKLKRFEDLVQTLRRHAEAVEGADAKLDLLLAAARVLAEEVGAPERAIELVERALEHSPKDPEALELLAQYRARAGDAQAAVEATVRLAQSEPDRKRAAELWVKAGRMLEEAGDRDGAIVKYKEALDADPSHKEAASALRRLFAERGDVQGAIELLEREIEATEGPIRKADLYAELGALLRDRVGDRDAALKAYEQAAELDPTDTQAVLGLGMLRFERGEWKEAARWLQVVASRWEKLPPEVGRQAALALAEAYERSEEPDRALQTLQAAREQWPEATDVLERLAELSARAERWSEAAEHYERLVQLVGEERVGADRGRLLAHYGEALGRAGRHEKAREVLEEAAELLPEEPTALEALRALHAEQGDWPGVVEVLHRLQKQAEPARRAELLVEEGDVWLDKLGNRDEAARRYAEALELQEDNRNVLTKLMAVYSEAKDWSRLVEVILRIAEFVEESGPLGKYYLTAASIAHRELKRHAEAADYYERALEADPKLQDAFDGLVQCLTEAEDWESLCDAYRAQLERGREASAEQRAAWWDALGETLRDKLGRPAEAIEAFEEALQLDPENPKRLEALADIYAADPARHLRRAVQIQEQLLQHAPYRVEHYRRLGELYGAVGHEDGRWAVAQTLSVLRQAGPEEKALYERHRRSAPIEAQRFVGEDLWFQHLVHPSQDPMLTEIFSLVLPAVAEGTLVSPEEAGISADTRIDPADGTVPMAGMLQYAAALLELPLPELHRRPQDPGGLSYVWSRPPVVGLGQGALGEAPPQALAFVAARHLSYLRPGHLLRLLVPRGRGLRGWLLAAIEAAQPGFPVPPAMKDVVGRNREAIERTLQAEEREELAAVVHRLLAAAPELDLKRWIAAVDLTADRVGFLVAGDLEVAAAVIKASPEQAAGASSRERLKELYLYSVSDAYLRLREHLGIDVEG